MVQLPTEVVLVAAEEEAEPVKGVDGRGKGSVVGRSCADTPLYSLRWALESTCILLAKERAVHSATGSNKERSRAFLQWPVSQRT